jgi:iron complex outermembrane receptor protein
VCNNGQAAPAQYQKVVVFSFENRTWSGVGGVGFGSMPYLHSLAASYLSTPQTISDGTDHVDPASLRGLGPDQVLVLINGKRRHRSALMHINGTFGRGTVGTDLNAIAAGSIKRIEILRDGAASQYGSDAIAGVINIVTKDVTDLLDVSTEAGITASRDGAS